MECDFVNAQKNFHRIIQLHGIHRLTGFNITLPMTKSELADFLPGNALSHVTVIFKGTFAVWKRLTSDNQILRLIATHSQVFNLEKKLLAHVIQAFADHGKECGLSLAALAELPDNLITQLFENVNILGTETVLDTEVVPGAPDLAAETATEKDAATPTSFIGSVFLQRHEQTPLSSQETAMAEDAQLLKDFYKASGLEPSPKAALHIKKAAGRTPINDYEEFATSVAAMSGTCFLDGYPYPNGNITISQIRHMLMQADKRCVHMFPLLIKIFKYLHF